MPQSRCGRKKARRETEATLARLEDAPTLWSGVLTATNHTLQGHAMLHGCRVGQRVDVLEEDTGPGSRYLTVVDRTRGVLGMYPAAWVAAEA